jgi:hypothetical protein
MVNDATLKVTVAIAPDCRLGEHLFRIRTATGISDARTFWVGALPSVAEVEPNSEFDKPQSISMNCTVQGSIGGEDVDYFVVECKKGQRLSVEIEAMRLGIAFWDPYIAILNEKRFELITNDDSPMIGQDSGCSILVPAAGKNIIMVREAAFGAGNQYRLHVGNFPRPTAVIPAGGKPGETIEARFIGDPLGDIKQKITLPAVADPLFRLHCQNADGISPTGFKCQIADLPNFIESGANITPAAAPLDMAPAAFHGIVSKNGETKFFKFPVKKGQVFDIRCYARQLGSPLDTVLNLYDSKGSVFATNDDSGGPDSYLRYTAPDDRELILGVLDHLKKGGPDYFFRIEVTPVTPRTTTNLPKSDGNNQSNQDRQAIAIPKGGRYATLVNIARADWGAPTILAFNGLPAGVSASHPEVEAGMTSVPVVFEAKPEAETRGGMAEFLANPAAPKLVALPRTSLDINFCIGGNNVPYHKVFTSHIASAVTEKSAYSIEVIEPKAPIPQNGVYQLRVVAKRAEGFTGPIRLFPLLAPPGIGIVGTVEIPAGANEASMTVNAAPNAAPRKWKTAVTASADTGRGLVWTSSQLFTLEVAPPLAIFAQERSAVEQGATTQVFGKLTLNTPFTGEAIVKLVGMPTKTTAPDLKIGPDAKELSFTVTTEKTTPAGKNTVFGQLTAVVNGETIVQNIGGGELRVDVPLPPKVAVTPAPMGTTPAPMPTKPPEKRLTRLEQLRLEQEEREKAEKAGQPAPPKKEEPKK